MTTTPVSIRHEFATVASEPTRGFDLRTGRSLAPRLWYADKWIESLPGVLPASHEA